MNCPRSRISSKTWIALTLICAIAPALAGCARTVHSAAVKPQVTRMAASASWPSIITEKPVLYDVSHLADLPRQTPFMPLVAAELMRDLDNQGLVPDSSGIPVTTVMPAAPPVNPFAGISLTGVMVHPKHPMALLAMGDKTIVVQEGQTLNNTETTPASDLVVRKIDKRSITLFAPDQGNGDSVRTLMVSSLFGYHKATQVHEGDTQADKRPEQADISVSESRPAPAPAPIKNMDTLPGELKSILKSYLHQGVPGNADNGNVTPTAADDEPIPSGSMRIVMKSPRAKPPSRGDE